MCGLVGFVGSIDSARAKSVIDQMTKGLVHRGPDAQVSKTWELGSGKVLGLGHTLLRIFGEEGEGLQPFIVDDSALVFNGAIYNFLELRSDLEKKGVKFKTSTDTEVLAWGLRKEGFAFLKKARGMYAFAFYQPDKKSLLVGRDPLGVKPLYLYRFRDQIAFASEYKVLLPHLSNLEINEEAIGDYLRVRYVPGMATLIKQIQKVAPGTVLEVDLDSAEVRENRFFDLAQCEGSEDIFLSLKNAISRRAVATVPVAALLSGGIDSALVCDYLSESVKHLKSYTLKVGNDDHDESEKAKIIASRIGIENVTLTSSGANIERLRELVLHLDDPYGDPIILALDRIFRTIGRSERVLVTGEGSDELFSGYVHHRAVGLLDKVPGFLFGIGSYLLRFLPVGLIGKLLPYSGKMSRSDLKTAIRRLRSVRLNDLTSIQRIFFLFDEEDVLNPSTSFRSHPSRSRIGLSELRDWDFRNWLTHSQLFKLDKIAMASSIEAREPFVDQDLVASVQRIPASKHIALHTDKPVLRELVFGRTRIGDDVVRSRKTSFFQPFDTKNLGTLPDQIRDLVARDRAKLEGFIKPAVLDELLHSKDGGLLNQKRVFALGILLLWFEEVWSLRNKNGGHFG